MEYLGSSTGQMMSRLDTERAAGTYTVDCICGGATSMYTVAHPKGWLEDLTQVIFHPEATDATKWISARPWFMDPEQKQIVRLSTQLTLHVGVNSELVNHNELKKWSDLLDPKYKGKISVYDPTVSGTGWNTANYLLRQLGDDFVKKLYVDQDPGISREDRQLADWMARGQYPITLGLNSTELEPLRADGFKIELVLEDTPEAPGITTAGWGLGVLLKNAPHPNASKLFMNWIVMRGGQRAFNEPLEYMSVRSDVDSAWAPDYVKAKPGRQYLDTYDWDFVQATRNPTELERLKRLVTKA
jgi:iron(III) transport system substrate-binding protein